MPIGKCLCQAVEYSVEGPFLYAGYCHCSQCRRASGSAFNAFAGARRSSLKILRGGESIATYKKAEDSELHFCRICGSNLFSVKRNAGLVHIRMGTLIDQPAIKPMAHVFVGSKAPWDEITDALPQFQEGAPRPPTAA